MKRSLSRIIAAFVVLSFCVGCEQPIDEPASSPSSQVDQKAPTTTPSPITLKAPVLSRQNSGRPSGRSPSNSQLALRAMDMVNDNPERALDGEVTRRTGGVLGKDLLKRYEIDHIRLGRSRRKVERLIGEGQPSTEGGAVYYGHPFQVTSIVYENDKVVQLSGEMLNTQNGPVLIKGDSVDVIRERLGSPEKSFDSGQQVWRYRDRGNLIEVLIVDGSAELITIKRVKATDPASP